MRRGQVITRLDYPAAVRGAYSTFPANGAEAMPHSRNSERRYVKEGQNWVERNQRYADCQRGVTTAEPH